MLLDNRNYPACMQQLGDAARASAKDIVDTLRAIGMEESKTLRIALASAHRMELDAPAPAPLLFDEDLLY